MLISSAEEAKDQREHDRKDKRCHDREIDADISIRALVFDITWQKRKAGRDAGPLGSRASVREPTNEGKSQHHDNEDFEKGIHHAIGERLGPTSQLQLDLGPSGRQRPSFIMMPGMSAIGNSCPKHVRMFRAHTGLAFSPSRCQIRSTRLSLTRPTHGYEAKAISLGRELTA
jgi:hypothetical protein